MSSLASPRSLPPRNSLARSNSRKSVNISIALGGGGGVVAGAGEGGVKSTELAYKVTRVSAHLLLSPGLPVELCCLFELTLVGGKDGEST